MAVRERGVGIPYECALYRSTSCPVCEVNEFPPHRGIKRHLYERHRLERGAWIARSNPRFYDEETPRSRRLSFIDR